MQNSAYVQDVLGQFGFLDASESEGILFSLVWKIDPSGYVYDIETSERLAGVTTTVYWISFDEKDENTMPAETEFGTLWNAVEWDQINPIITDSDGRYAWDVPEGWWRVKYEKEGYATVWSNWMTVPPVQTDVNIGMTSTTVEGYGVKFVSSTTTSTTVSLTNNTLAASSVVFIIAAYNRDGKMIAVNTVEKNIAAAGSIDLTVSYKETDNVYNVKAFVVQKETMTPLCETWSKKMVA